MGSPTHTFLFGYFAASGGFFKTITFAKVDIFVDDQLCIDQSGIDFKNYNSITLGHHRELIWHGLGLLLFGGVYKVMAQKGIAPTKKVLLI